MTDVTVTIMCYRFRCFTTLKVTDTLPLSLLHNLEGSQHIVIAFVAVTTFVVSKCVTTFVDTLPSIEGS